MFIHTLYIVEIKNIISNFYFICYYRKYSIEYIERIIKYIYLKGFYQHLHQRTADKNVVKMYLVIKYSRSNNY